MPQIKTVATGLALTLAVGCASPESTYVGTWQIDLGENTTDSPVTFHIAPDQKVYVIDQSDPEVAYEISLTKVNDDWNLPENVEILPIAQDLHSDNSASQNGPATEAVTYIGALNRAQQAYRLESPEFTTQIDALGLGIEAETEFYSYQILTANDLQAVAFARPTQPDLPSVLGVVALGENQTTTAIVCQSLEPDQAAPTLPERSAADEPDCPAGFEET